MKYAYPQNASQAIDAIRRQDELSDIAGREQQLDIRQEVASIGDTVPLIFCKRFDVGGGYGDVGGVWISPNLLQIGLDQTDVSLLYLLSQGKFAGIDSSLLYWGDEKLSEAEPNASSCMAYEQVPDCVDLSYEPGSTVSWSETFRQPGPSRAGSVTTADNTTEVSVTFDPLIFQKAEEWIVSGYSGTFGVDRCYSGEEHPGSTDAGVGGGYGPAYGLDTGQKSIKYQSLYGMSPSTSETIAQRPIWQRKHFDFKDKHVFKQWHFSSRVVIEYELYDVKQDVLHSSGTKEVRDTTHGGSNTSLSFGQLPPSQYRLTFKNIQTFNTEELDKVVIPNPGTDPDTVNDVWRGVRAPNFPSNTDMYRLQTFAGYPLTVDLASTFTYKVTTTIEYPDLPAGSLEGDGALVDLTVLGIKGDVRTLRPSGQIDYFKQAHLFVKNGIEVDRLLDGQVSSSSDYPDLVYYLMRQSRVIADDQIALQSMKDAAKLCQYYRLYYNGILQTTQNLAEWITRTAPYFLLIPTQINGQYGFAPVSPMAADGSLSQQAVTPVLTLTKDDIVAGTYRRRYIAARERRPVCLIMVYRVQPDNTIGQTSTVEVRYRNTALSGPFEQHDLSEFCTHPEAAVTAARCILAKRRYTLHECQMQVTRVGKNLTPGDIIRVTLDTLTTDGDGIDDSYLYQIDTVTEGLEGTVNLTMTHFPVDSDGRSMVAMEVASSDVTVQ